MKSLLFLFVVLTTCVYANKNRNHYKTKNNSPTKNIDGLYKFKGKLNNRIPVFVWFVVKDSVLKGEVTYLKTAKRTPITIIGTIEKDNALEFFEFGKSGYITGIYRGLFNTSSLTGSWFAPETEKELKYSLTLKDTVINVVDKNLYPELIDGTYVYRYGKLGSSGGINIKHISGSDYFIEINCVTSSPANNVAEIERTKVTMHNNTIIYKVPEDKCKYRIRAFKNFVVINRLSEYGNCFGMGAGPEGVFIKTKEIPEFSF